MFESYARSRQHASVTRAIPWIVGGLVVHAMIVGAMWVRSLWNVEKLERPTDRIMVSMFAPPPPPPPASAGAKPASERPRKRVTRTVQPVPADAIEEPVASATTTAVSNPAGEAAGEDGGVALGVTGGVIDAPAVATPAPVQAAATPPRPLGRYDKLRIQSPDPESRGKSGTIEVVMDIDPAGKVVRVMLIRGLTQALDGEALAAARRFRWMPARDPSGLAVASRARWTFHVAAVATATTSTF
jgi:TonB family protein